MTEKAMNLRIYKNKIENLLEEKFDSELLKNPYAEGRRAFHKGNGEVFCIDAIAGTSCLVIEHADSIEDAERLTLEDGGLYSTDDYKDEHKMLEAMLREIND